MGHSDTQDAARHSCSFCFAKMGANVGFLHNLVQALLHSAFFVPASCWHHEARQDEYEHCGRVVQKELFVALFSNRLEFGANMFK
jgi:hypothetical protein